MKQTIFLIYMLCILTYSCKEHDYIEDHSISSKFQDSILNTRTRSASIKYVEEEDSLNNARLEREFQQFLNAKEGEKVYVQDAEELNQYIQKKLNKGQKTFSSSTSKHEEKSNRDFEFSDFWRKEAFKIAREYIKQEVQEKGCSIFDFSVYNPNQVRYEGGATYSIILKYTYDCNLENFLQETVSLESRYQGNGKWEVKKLETITKR